jgi:dTDP-4-dehydrorhamnose 3,5-epimerase
MRFTATHIGGVLIVSSDIHTDERGSFQRSYCSAEFAEHGLEPLEAQAAISRNTVAGTLRGLHFIPENQGEAKLVRCVAGRIFDVAVDLRTRSPTYLQHVSVELDADSSIALYLPRGVAHGFVTLQDSCDLLYQFSQAHRPGLEKGVRWDDPELAIPWPLQPTVVSDRDRALPFVEDLCRG